MKYSFKHFIKYRFPAILWALIIFTSSSIPGKYLPTPAIFIFDKLFHIVVFFVFAVLVYRALMPVVNPTSFSWKRNLLTLMFVISYGIIDELYQGTVSGRTLDVWDGVADLIGGILAVLTIYFVYRRKRVQIQN